MSRWPGRDDIKRRDLKAEIDHEASWGGEAWLGIRQSFNSRNSHRMVIDPANLMSCP